MEKLSLKQGGQKWLDLKKTRIGSSEIFGLIKHYITSQELQNVGINTDNFKDEAYTTAWQLYQKFVNPMLYVEAEFDKNLSIFGRRIEEFSFDYLKKQNKHNSNYSKGGVYFDNLKIASLDIRGKANSLDIIQDSNGFNISLADYPEFLVETKGHAAFVTQSKNVTTQGADWKFIFQLQYALYLTKTKWGKIFMVSLFNDNEFERGYISGLSKKTALKYIADNSEIFEFVYIARPEYQYLIEKALNRFQFDLESHNEPALPDYEKVFYKNHKFFYNLVHQKAQLLGTAGQALQTNEFDYYFKVKLAEDRFKNKFSRMNQRIREKMLLTGKTKFVSDKGAIQLQANCVMGKAIKMNKEDNHG